MSDYPVTPKRKLWLRALWMILMGLAHYLASTLLCCVALIQFVLVLVSNAPNSRLMAFGRSLGRYQGQIASFVSFASDEPPFPLADWPSSD